MTQSCKFSWCTKKVHAAGMCAAHCSNYYKLGEANPPSLARKIGTRTVLAKTCLHCGVLTPASKLITSNAKGGVKYIQATCRGCAYHGYDSTKSAGHGKYMKKLNDELRDKATNHYERWSDREMDLLERTDLTGKQKAELLGRTYRAVVNKQRKLKKAEEEANAERRQFAL